VSTQDKVKINKLPTGVPGLDEIVGGGLPEFSFNVIAGTPGSGKTTLAHQFVFANGKILSRPSLVTKKPWDRLTDRMRSRKSASGHETSGYASRKEFSKC
jgi:replicative DNA helicase